MTPAGIEPATFFLVTLFIIYLRTIRHNSEVRKLGMYQRGWREQFVRQYVH